MEKTRPKCLKTAVIAAAVVALMLAACALASCQCGAGFNSGASISILEERPSDDAEDVEELAGAAEKSVADEPSAGPAASNPAPAPSPSGSAATGGSTSSSAQEPSSNGTSSGSASGSQPAAKPSHEHSWTAVTGQRWVVDQAAWDEDVYKTNLICSCGLTWSSGTEWSRHNEQLMLDGGGCRHQSKPIYVETIHHEEVGHYETVTTGYKCSCGATK